jgi:peptide/nickel transport system ATP-binding protein
LVELIKISGLNVRFHTYEGIVEALNGVNLTIFDGETLGLVGETGSGKTVTGLAILRLIMPPGKIESGSIFFNPDGQEPIDLLKISEADMRAVRGSQIAMVFQEPGAALNPVFTIGDQLTEGIILHRSEEVKGLALETARNKIKENTAISFMVSKPFYLLKINAYRWNENDFRLRLLQRIPVVRGFLRGGIREEASRIATAMLRDVEIPDPDRIIKQYPHELSGGMKQRVVIAMALACCSRLIIADEPTTSLDATIQVQIVELLKKLKRETGISLLYITHNLGVAAELCDRVAVMYAGNICEIASVFDIFKAPLHPYTRALMAAVPKPGEEPHTIGGSVPDALALPSGCRFHPRCQEASAKCFSHNPELIEAAPGHFVACDVYGKA